MGIDVDLDNTFVLDLINRERLRGGRIVKIYNSNLYRISISNRMLKTSVLPLQIHTWVLQ